LKFLDPPLIKVPPCSKTLNAKHRPKFCSPSAAMVTFPYNEKTNTIPILMHQMRTSTYYVSSVMLRPKKLEIREKENVKTMKNPVKTK
jgi:hypothetical protein